jgi:predicted MFS family arabinose efflux permease
MTFSRLHPVHADSMTARILLSFLASAGLFYVNIMPALTEGLKVGLGFTNQQAGQVGAFNMYGGAVGALLVTFFVSRLAWRATSNILLFGLVLADLASMGVTTPDMLMGLRFLHGVMGGMLVGIGFSVFARSTQPDRTFGVLLVVQTLAGGLGVMTLPPLVPVYGSGILYWALIGFSCVTVLMVACLPDYPPRASAASRAGKGTDGPVLLAALVAVFLFQAANMGLYSYLIGLGKHAGLAPSFVSTTLAIANWVGTLGAVLVVVLSNRFGMFWPVIGAILIDTIASAALVESRIAWLWIAANIAAGMTWNFGIAYLLGMCSRFDGGGKAAVWAGFASKIGLASGPMLGSLIIGQTDYVHLIVMAIVCLIASMAFAGASALHLDRLQSTEAGT